MELPSLVLILELTSLGRVPSQRFCLSNWTLFFLLTKPRWKNRLEEVIYIYIYIYITSLRRYIYIYIYIYISTPWHKQDVTQGQYLSGIKQVWIQSFPSLRQITIQRLKSPICSIFYSYLEGEYFDSYLSWRQLHKNVASNIEQVLAATPHKVQTIRAPASHHENYPNLDEPDTQDTAGEAKTSSQVTYSFGPLHMAKQKKDDRLEHTYSSYVRIQDVALKTY